MWKYQVSSNKTFPVDLIILINLVVSLTVHNHFFLDLVFNLRVASRNFWTNWCTNILMKKKKEIIIVKPIDPLLHLEFKNLICCKLFYVPLGAGEGTVFILFPEKCEVNMKILIHKFLSFCVVVTLKKQ